MSAIPGPYVPSDGKLFTVSMGLRALEISQWLELDHNYEAEILQKRNLLSANRHQVFQAVDAGRAGSDETLSLIQAHLIEYFPQGPSVAHRENLMVKPESEVEEHPLVLASLLVQEDLCVMSRIGDQWVLTAAVVCFPSRWDLTTKIGANLHVIHAPVPHYEERIGTATDVMFDKFTADRPVWRVNWTILDSPDLYQPSSSHSSFESSSGEFVASGKTQEERVESTLAFSDATYLRIERQTLRVLPSSGDVLFTIRTYVDSLTNVTQTFPDFPEQLSATLAGVSAETRRYKGWDSMWQALNSWTQGR